MGALQDYLREVRKLTPEDAQPEVLTFVALLGSDGTIVFQSASLRVTPGYMFALEQIMAACPVPPQMPDDASGARVWTIAEFLPYIGFNVLNEGRQRPIFKLPLAMSLFTTAVGARDGLKFSVPFTFFEGADISVEWFVDTASLQQTYPLGPGLVTPRVFNPGQVGPLPRIEFYAYLIGSLVRAEKIQ